MWETALAEEPMDSKTLVALCFYLMCGEKQTRQDGDRGFRRLSILDPIIFTLTVTFLWP